MIPYKMMELDKPRRMRLGMGAMVEFEEITGKSLMNLSDEDLKSMITCKFLLWVMLKAEEPTLTPENVMTLVDEHAKNMGYVIEILSEAVELAFGDKEDEDEDPNVKPLTLVQDS